MDQAWWAPGVATPEVGGAFTVGFRGGLVVDQAGSATPTSRCPTTSSVAQMDRPGPRPVVRPLRRAARRPVPRLRRSPACRPGSTTPRGTWVSADTLEELAAQIGVPAEALVATVNSSTTSRKPARRGLRPWRRRVRPLLRRPRCWRPVDQPPVRRCPRLVLADLGTKGGLVTDADSRVLRDGRRTDRGPVCRGQHQRVVDRPVLPGPGHPDRQRHGLRLPGGQPPGGLTGSRTSDVRQTRLSSTGNAEARPGRTSRAPVRRRWRRAPARRGRRATARSIGLPRRSEVPPAVLKRMSIASSARSVARTWSRRVRSRSSIGSSSTGGGVGVELGDVAVELEDRGVDLGRRARDRDLGELVVGEPAAAQAARARGGASRRRRCRGSPRPRRRPAR